MNNLFSFAFLIAVTVGIWSQVVTAETSLYAPDPAKVAEYQSTMDNGADVASLTSHIRLLIEEYDCLRSDNDPAQYKSRLVEIESDYIAARDVHQRVRGPRDPYFVFRTITGPFRPDDMERCNTLWRI